ncbi:GNAT family N-acetyltransferase [Hippea sp. KM1]|uniref:GNAT family N-acetyltransferase n=1 Tax=Hippea sp. KM1 TaxID=944481 RepID=UPI00046D75FA|nr:GNAT family N-acetyltransferase [Hippea sp. KM1]
MINFELSVQDDLVSLRIVQSFIVESARVSGFEKEELDRFYLIAEEAFSYVLRLLKADKESRIIRIITRIDPKHFIVSFFDKGIPLPKADESNETEKLSLSLIQAYCDRLIWVNHGKEGKELRLLFNKPQKDITQYEMLFEQESEEEPSDEIYIEPLKPKNAYQVSRLIYKTYGYSYPNGDMYYPEVIEAMNKSKELISITAIDKKYGKVVGHYAIEKLSSKSVAELGQAAVDPAYRGKKLAKSMRKKLEELALDLKLKGIFSQPVTSHTGTQKINEEFGSKACGVSFGLVPKEFNYKKMEIKPLSERESCILYFKPLASEKRLVYLPEKHSAIMKKIYGNLDFETETPSKPLYDNESLIDSKYNAPWGFGTINVLSISKNLSKEIKSAFNRLRLSTQAEVVFLNIPLNDAPLDEHIDKIEEMGFFFCGVAPYILDGKDAVRFQYLNTLIDTDRIKVYGSFAKELFNYSVSMMKRVLW